MEQQQELKFDLIENAIDSIVHGLEHYADGKKSIINYKFAILHITQGIELILKERLRREHEVLIFKEVDKPNTGKTIDFDTAIKRLKGICKIDLDDNTEKNLYRLRTSRNNIEHYKVDLSEEETTALVGSNIKFLLDFLEKQLGTKLQDRVDRKIWSRLLAIEDIWEKAWHAAYEERKGLLDSKAEGEDYPKVVQCPGCFLEFLVVKDKNAKRAECLMCKHTSRLKECTGCHLLYPIDERNPFDFVEKCPDCTAQLRSLSWQNEPMPGERWGVWGRPGGHSPWTRPNASENME